MREPPSVITTKGEGCLHTYYTLNYFPPYTFTERVFLYGTQVRFDTLVNFLLFIYTILTFLNKGELT